MTREAGVRLFSGILRGVGIGAKASMAAGVDDGVRGDIKSVRGSNIIGWVPLVELCLGEDLTKE